MQALVGYNICMRKFKIFFTLFVIYEFVIVVILHRLDYCTNFFALNFCEYQIYKYLFMCLMLPVLIGVLLWWWHDISGANKSCNVESQNTNDNTISRHDIEYFVSTLVLIAIQHFFKKHKKTESIFFDILNAMKASDKTKSS
jgi:hypothetical protein